MLEHKPRSHRRLVVGIARLLRCSVAPIFSYRSENHSAGPDDTKRYQVYIFLPIRLCSLWVSGGRTADRFGIKKYVYGGMCGFYYGLWVEWRLHKPWRMRSCFCFMVFMLPAPKVHCQNGLLIS